MKGVREESLKQRLRNTRMYRYFGNTQACAHSTAGLRDSGIY